LSWITDALEPVNAEFRDDRFSAAFDRSSGAPAVFTVAYVVRAVSPGRYVLPQAYVEDMRPPLLPLLHQGVYARLRWAMGERAGVRGLREC
jgi:hypothetical protein